MYITHKYIKHIPEDYRGGRDNTPSNHPYGTPVWRYETNRQIISSRPIVSPFITPINWCPTQVHKIIVIWFWVGLPRGVIPSTDILYISDPKVMARLSQGHKNQDGRPKMLNSQQTTETAIILLYFVFQSYLISAFLHIFYRFIWNQKI